MFFVVTTDCVVYDFVVTRDFVLSTTVGNNWLFVVAGFCCQLFLFLYEYIVDDFFVGQLTSFLPYMAFVN